MLTHNMFSRRNKNNNNNKKKKTAIIGEEKLIIWRYTYSFEMPQQGVSNEYP